MARITLTVVAVLVASAPAIAQDFGREWINRVTNELQVERGPLEAKPVDFHASAGVQYQFDSNVFLEENNERDDSIIIPFAQARLEYQEQNFLVVADALVNYNIYTDLDDANDHEERLYVRARQTDQRYSFQISEILSRVSDPFDPTVATINADRAARLRSDTIAQASFDLTEAWFFEANGRFSVVRWLDDPLDDFADNNNARADGGFGWRTPYGFDLLAQVGWYGIFMDEDLITPDSDGVYVRGGFRGDVLEDLAAEILVGWTQVESDDFVGPVAPGIKHSTMDAAAHLRYQATERVNLAAGYARVITYSLVPRDPWQIVNQFSLRADLEATEQIKLFARGQYNINDSSQGIERTFYIVGGGATYTINQYLVIDASVNFRSGETEGSVVTNQEWDSFIVSAGLAFTY